MPTFTSTTPLPKFYYYALAIGEPLGMFAGALFAIGFPQSFYNAYLPSSYGSALGIDDGGRGRLVASGMGSCMLIIGLMSGLTLPTMSRVLAKHPEMHERLLTPLLAALQFGDFMHIALTLYNAPASLRWTPSAWTILFWGNVAGTAAPMLVRLMWFAGIGRPTYGTAKEVKKAGYERVASSDQERSTN